MAGFLLHKSAVCYGDLCDLIPGIKYKIADAVGDHEQVGFDAEVVPKCLRYHQFVERGVGQVDRAEVRREDEDRVAEVDRAALTVGQPVEQQFFFNRDVGGGYFFLCYQVIQHMLAHPFFGTQHQPFFADDVKDAGLAGTLF